MDASDVVAPQGGRSRISVRRLTCAFMDRRAIVVALNDVSLDVREGEFLCVVGPSGCGKTTLLRVIAGLEKPTAGTVDVRREDTKRPLTAMVFQENSLLPWRSVRQNISFGLDMRSVPAPERTRIVDSYLKKTGLERFADAYPHQLSGGMKQRVALARALANGAEVLLMDEPFAAADEQTKSVLQQELLRIWDGERKTVVYVTHSIEEAISLSDRIVVMTARPGRIKTTVQVGFPRPRDIHALRADPAFGNLTYQIWNLIREEVTRSMQAEESTAIAG